MPVGPLGPVAVVPVLTPGAPIGLKGLGEGVTVVAVLLRLPAAPVQNEETGVPSSDNPKRYKKEVSDAIEFIHLHFAEKITLDDVAKAVNLNRNYLCRLFKQETGGQMFSYLNALRMQKAAELIAGGDTYVRGVAAAVGISDQFYFARVFKKHLKMTPSEYGKQKGEFS